MTLIQIFGTGGTIASRGKGPAGAVAVDSAGSLVQTISSGHTVVTADLLTVGSYRLGLGDLRSIAETVSSAVNDDRIDGVVVTHGTDTMEETAFLLDLVHASHKCVVLTGAQRTADSDDPDGPLNVHSAVNAAASRKLRGAGVLIAFAGVIRTARGARKAHTTAINPFAGGLELARVVENSIVITADKPARRPPLPLPGESFDAARIEVISAYPGATPDLFNHAAAASTGAIILAGTGTGNAGPGFADAVARAVDSGCHVILSSRSPWGPVVPGYGDGGGTDLVKAGAIPSGDLNPFQSRILAALLLSHGPGPGTFRETFSAYADPADRSVFHDSCAGPAF